MDQTKMIKTIALLFLAGQSWAIGNIREQDFHPNQATVLPSSVTVRGPLTVNGGITGAVATGSVDFSTIAANLSTKLSSGPVPNNFIDLSTVTTAIAGKQNSFTGISSTCAAGFYLDAGQWSNGVAVGGACTVDGGGGGASTGPWTTQGAVVKLATSTDNVVVQTTMTIQGNAFSVGGSTFSVVGGSATVAYRMTAASFAGNGSALTGLPGGCTPAFSSASVTTTFTTTSTSFVSVAGTTTTMTLGGTRPVRYAFFGGFRNDTASTNTDCAVSVDGVTPTVTQTRHQNAAAFVTDTRAAAKMTGNLSAGSHSFHIMCAAGAGTSTFWANTVIDNQLSVIEVCNP